MPARRKPDSARQDQTHPGRALVPADSLAGVVPLDVHPPEKGWLVGSKAAWSDFWGSDVSQAIGRHHLPALYRLFDLRDAQTRALRLYKARPMVDGSTGQPVTNPSMGTALSLEKAISALEDRIGLTPKAQAALGIAIGQQKLTAAELNRLAAEVDDDGDVGADVIDAEGEWEAVE